MEEVGAIRPIVWYSEGICQDMDIFTSEKQSCGEEEKKKSEKSENWKGKRKQTEKIQIIYKWKEPLTIKRGKLHSSPSHLLGSWHLHLRTFPRGGSAQLHLPSSSTLTSGLGHRFRISFLLHLSRSSILFTADSLVSQTDSITLHLLIILCDRQSSLAHQNRNHATQRHQALSWGRHG